MDFIRSAASAVLAKSTGPFPNFTIGAPLLNSPSASPTIWAVHEGIKKDDASPCTILIFDASTRPPNAKGQLVLAKNALRKLRTLRHPDVLKLIDSAETATAVYVAVEPVRLLQPALDEWVRNGGTEEGKKEWVTWGLSKVANALKFINVDATAIHGNLRPESIFLSQGGEWRLGGFELLTAKQDYEGVIWNHGGLLPDASMWASPEVRQGGWNILRDLEPHCLDVYSFALLAFSAYNGLVPTGTTSMPPQGSVPSSIFALLRRMMVPNPKTRAPISSLLDSANAEGGIWKENRLNQLSSGCENLMLATERERTETLRSLSNSSSTLPSDFLTHRVLPSLVNALTLSAQASAASGASISNTVNPSTVLGLVLQLGGPLAEREWEASVLPCILKAFTLPDRTVRMTLLEHLPTYVQRIPQKGKAIDVIWTNFLTGFADSSAAIREATLKSILPLSPRLSDRIRNNDLLRQLAKTQVDIEPGIRTNTTILLGRLAPELQANTRKSVLIPAFSRSLKDPFVHARTAGLMALMATSETYDKDDLAKSVLPAMCPCLVDKERLVREQAEKALEMFWTRIREEVKGMPETILPPDASSHQMNGSASSIEGGALASSSARTASGPPSLASTAGGAASALAGWAVDGAMSYFSSPDALAANGNTAGSMDNRRPPLLTGASSSSATNSRSASPMPPSSSGSQLATSSSSTTAATPSVPARIPGPNADLIDINDDTDDWTSFESATKKPVRRGLPGGSALKKSGLSSSNSPLAGGNQRNLAAKKMSSTGSEKLKPASHLQEDEVAWGESWAGGDETSTPAASQASIEAGTRAAAADFTMPVPGWSTPTNELIPPAPNLSTSKKKIDPVAAPPTTDEWSSFPDEEEDSSATAKSGTATPTTALSKEDKKAQMERQREERRERMRKLKESKGKKLGDSLA